MEKNFFSSKISFAAQKYIYILVIFIRPDYADHEFGISRSEQLVDALDNTESVVLSSVDQDHMRDVHSGKRGA